MLTLHNYGLTIIKVKSYVKVEKVAPAPVYEGHYVNGLDWKCEEDQGGVIC